MNAQPTFRQQVIDMLRDGDLGLTSKDIADATGMNRQYATRLLNQLNREKVVVIRSWQRTKNSIVPVYAYKRFKTWTDAPRPARLSWAEASRRYRERHKVLIAARRLAEQSKTVNPFGQLAGFTTIPRISGKEVEPTIVSMFNRGVQITSIARSLNCSVNTVARALMRLGLHTPRKRVRRADVEPAIIAMLEAGSTQKAIIQAVGCGKDLVGRVAREWRQHQ